MNASPTDPEPRGPFERAAERTARRRRARSQQRQRLGFRIHATVFVAMQILIFATWYVTSRNGATDYPWFVFPLVAWAVGLAAHFAAVSDSYLHRVDPVE